VVSANTIGSFKISSDFTGNKLTAYLFVIVMHIYKLIIRLEVEVPNYSDLPYIRQFHSMTLSVSGIPGMYNIYSSKWSALVRNAGK